MQKIIKQGTVLCSLFILSACAGNNGDAWPKLTEGFDIRPDPQQQAQEQTEVIGPDTPNAVAEPSIVSEYEESEIARLQAEIATQKQSCDAALTLMQSANGDDKQRHWFSAQLALSRLSALKDELNQLAPSGLQTYLSQLDVYYDVATAELLEIKP